MAPSRTMEKWIQCESKCHHTIDLVNPAMPVLARYDESKDDLVSSRPSGLQRYEETSSGSAGHDQEEFLGSTSTDHEGPTNLTQQFPMMATTVYD